MNGVLLVDKPAGVTSHDVVDHVRRAAGIRRVGHTGTLDPAATGLLILCAGPATRLSEFLTSLDKVYEGDMRLGITTDSYDLDGEVLSERDVPDLTHNVVGDAPVHGQERGPTVDQALQLCVHVGLAAGVRGIVEDRVPKQHDMHGSNSCSGVRHRDDPVLTF